jgi:hypothetical protein
MVRFRILIVSVLGLSLATSMSGTVYGDSTADPTSFCSDVQQMSTGFLDLENAAGDPAVIKDLIKDYKRLEHEAPTSIKQSIRVIRRLAEKFWKAHPTNAEEAAKVMNPEAVRKLSKASKKLGTYLVENCR